MQLTLSQRELRAIFADQKTAQTIFLNCLGELSFDGFLHVGEFEVDPPGAGNRGLNHAGLEIHRFKRLCQRGVSVDPLKPGTEHLMVNLPVCCCYSWRGNQTQLYFIFGKAAVYLLNIVNYGRDTLTNIWKAVFALRDETKTVQVAVESLGIRRLALRLNPGATWRGPDFAFMDLADEKPFGAMMETLVAQLSCSVCNTYGAYRLEPAPRASTERLAAIDSALTGLRDWSAEIDARLAGYQMNLRSLKTRSSLAVVVAAMD